ncbi:hypothetical protein IJ913_02630 [bacterium]|nr:hypothetical protein [bacterium]
MKLIKFFLMKRKNNNMIFIEKDDSELEVFEDKDLIFEDLVEAEQHLISEDSETFFEVCFDEIFDDEEEGSQPNEILLKSILVLALMRPIFEQRKKLHIQEK